MNHVTAPGDMASTAPESAAQRAAAVRIAKQAIGDGFAAMDAAQQREFETMILLGLHCAENLIGPPLGSEDVDTWLYDPLTGAPR